MSSTKDIKNKTQPVTKGAACGTVLKNQTAQGLACDEDMIDMIHHHNERGKKKERGPAANLPYIPDCERGMRPLPKEV